MKFKNLFTPIKLKDLNIKNRVVMAPMDTELAAPDGSVSDRFVHYYQARARGGAGLIITEFTAINNEQRLSSPGIYSDRMISNWRRLTEAVHTYQSKIFLQLAHHGGRAVERITGRKPVAPSSISSKLYQDKPRELSQDEIEALIEEFINASRRAKMAGFDGVEVHGGHTYLIGQFVSPHTNRRKDEYGGNFEGRMRFPAKIVEGIRDICGEDFPIGFKFSAYEALENGVDIHLGQRIGRYMQEVGVDYLHVSATTYGINGCKYSSVPPIYLENGTLVELAEKVKEKVEIPVLTVGGINAPEHAEKILKNEKANMVVIGRGLIADPDWVRKARKGERIRQCIRCNECHSRIFAQKEMRCSVNSEIGKEGWVKFERSTRSKRIHVVGGGPAGMEVAVRASERGHNVTLYEKESDLGGNMRASAKPPFKREVEQLLKYYKEQILQSDIQVKLNTKVSVETLLKEEPDVVVLAVGAKQVIPDIPGIDNCNVVKAVDLLVNDVEVGENIIVLGAGIVGCETAWYLSIQGKSVALIDVLARNQIMIDEHHTNRTVLLKEIENRGIDILDRAKIIEIKDDAVTLEQRGGSKSSLDMDNLVLAIGFTPRLELWNQINKSKLGSKCDLYRVGDCVKPGRFYEAINNGARIVRGL